MQLSQHGCLGQMKVSRETRVPRNFNQGIEQADYKGNKTIAKHSNVPFYTVPTKAQFLSRTFSPRTGKTKCTFLLCKETVLCYRI